MLSEHLVEKRRFQLDLKHQIESVCEIADRLFERLDYVKLTPKKVLIYGWGSQYEHNKIAARYPQSEVTNAYSLPQLIDLSDESFQLIVSNCALEWENEPKKILSEWHRLLADGGLIHFSTLGPDTGKEVAQAFASVDHFPHVHDFTDMHHIGDCLKKVAFQDPVVDMETITFAYEDLDDLFQELKQAGANNAHADCFRGLMTPKQWRKMCQTYEGLKLEGHYPFTLEVIYGHAWKVSKQEVSIPLDKISIKPPQR